MRHIAVFCLTVLLCMPLSACQKPEYSNIHATKSLELVEKGKRLRADINAVFIEMQHAPTLGPGRTITELVEKYIPVGTSFENAKAILLAANLKCDAGETPLDRNKGTWTYATSLIAKYHFPTPWYVSGDLEIDLFPTYSKDFNSKVGKIFAQISYAAI